MRTRTILASLAVFFAGIAICVAADSMMMGTWKLNEAKSKLSPGTPKNHMVVYSMAGDNMKVVVDGTDKDGKATHNEWTGKFDGKDYAVTGDSMSDMRSYMKVDDHKLSMVIKKGGKETMTGTVVVSADGKTRTVTTTGMDPMGMKMTSVGVYDKQ